MVQKAAALHLDKTISSKGMCKSMSYFGNSPSTRLETRLSFSHPFIPSFIHSFWLVSVTVAYIMGGSTAHGSDRTARVWSGCSGRAASESRGRCGSASLAMRRRERARGSALHHSPFPGCSVVSAQLCESSTPSYPPICQIHQTSSSGLCMIEWSRITSHLEKQSFTWWHP